MRLADGDDEEDRGGREEEAIAFDAQRVLDALRASRELDVNLKGACWGLHEAFACDLVTFGAMEARKEKVAPPA
jgi:hypothetical protein